MNDLYKEVTGDTVVKFFLIAACLVVLLAGIHAAANIINLVLLALLVSLSIYPFQRGLMKRGVPPVIAVIITIFFVILAGLVIVVLLYRTGLELSYRVPGYSDKLKFWYRLLRHIWISIISIFPKWRPILMKSNY